MKRSDAEVSLRTGLLSDEFTPDEQMAVLRAIQPKVEESVERTRESVVALSPPAEFEADHDRLLLFLSETLDVAQELTAAASGGDFDKVESELP